MTTPEDKVPGEDDLPEGDGQDAGEPKPTEPLPEDGDAGDEDSAKEEVDAPALPAADAGPEFAPEVLAEPEPTPDEPEDAQPQDEPEPETNPEAVPARTIVQPVPSGEPAASGEDLPQPDGPPRTIMAPAPASHEVTPPPAGPRTVVQPEGNALESAPPAVSPPPASAGRVSIGDVLNHIYKIDRYIARGGMGEVYEGHNLSTDEKVAIKVILPHLAADASVQAMFLKEARTLTRLQHPALVQYRLLAQEPALGVLYIATEFIDGKPLSELLGTLKGDEATLTKLIRRLADGLSAAHALGAIHRDLAPDNILLPDNRLELAKIIDFGIAKDLDTTKGTIVGEGFAGKLGYVAPEQLGDFGRDVGPWTDVYSLGLVMLTIAKGGHVDMGATLVEAVDRRRAEPDLSAAPEGLKPLLTAMLQPNPANRLRSMADVVAAIDDPSRLPEWATASTSDDDPGAKTVFMPAEPPAARAAKDAAIAVTDADAAQKRKRLALIGGVALAGVAIIAIGVSMFSGGDEKPGATGTKAATEATGSQASGPAVPAAERARAAIAAKLGSIPCSWLDLESVSDSGDGVLVSIVGVASNPVSAEREISQATSQAGVRLSNLNLESVAPVKDSMCRPLDVFRSIRADTSMSTPHVRAAQRTFEIGMQNSGKIEAKAVIDFQLPEDGSDFTLVGLEPSGKIDVIFESRAQFLSIAPTTSAIQDLGGGKYRIEAYTDHSGWSGLMLITGKQPFPADIIAPPIAARTAAWPEKFRQAAEKGGWRGEMDWYKTVNERPD